MLYVVARHSIASDARVAEKDDAKQKPFPKEFTSEIGSSGSRRRTPPLIRELSRKATLGTFRGHRTKGSQSAQTASQRQRKGLLLSRQHVLQQLEAAQNPRHRQILQNALADLDAQLARLV